VVRNMSLGTRHSDYVFLGGSLRAGRFRVRTTVGVRFSTIIRAGRGAHSFNFILIKALENYLSIFSKTNLLRLLCGVGKLVFTCG
jgi:hypothetical protein